MQQKFIDFLSSIGIMIFGVGLVFFCSVTLTAQPVQNFVTHLPVAQVQPFKTGGDEALPALPASRPILPLPKEGSADYVGSLTAVSAAVVDDESSTILYKKNIDEVRSLASITKLMTALVLSELPINWSSSTVITDDDTDPSSHHLEVGEKYTLEALWHVALIGSSNSAIHALVRESGLTEDEFVVRMNQKAVMLGLNTLHFVEPTGLDSRNMGQALDILRLLRIALKNTRISETLKTPEYYAVPQNKKTKHQVWSTDWLLTSWIPNDFDKDVLVGKTGYIDQSGYNFVVRVPGKNSQVVRVVVLGASSNETRFTEARDLAKWAFENYVWPNEVDYASTSAH